MLATIGSKLLDNRPEPAQPLGTAREAAVLVALTREPNVHVVLIKRAAHLTNHGGEVAFPGGMWDSADTSLLHTALREAEEEIALPAQRVEVIARLPAQLTRRQVRVTPYVGVFAPEERLAPDLTELDAVFRVPLAHFLDPANFGIAEFVILDGTYQLPCCRFQDYQIWGFTLMVLVKFLNQTLAAGLELDYGNTGLPNLGGIVR